MRSSKRITTLQHAVAARAMAEANHYARMVRERMVTRTLKLDARQHERLRALSEATRVPAANCIREGIDAVLDLAETQQRTVEAIGKGKSNG